MWLPKALFGMELTFPFAQSCLLLFTRFWSQEHIQIISFPELLSQSLILIETSLRQPIYLRGTTSDIAENVISYMM